MSLQPQVVWFTGLSGSGKSTLCNAVHHHLIEQGRRVEVLDGDIIRLGICAGLGFSLEDRFENIRRIAAAATSLAQGETIVLVAAITPLNIMRAHVRATLPHVLEVFVDAPLAVCEFRDVKGLYRKARAGTLPHFTGLPTTGSGGGFEVPPNPDLICHTDKESIAESSAKVFALLQRYSEAE